MDMLEIKHALEECKITTMPRTLICKMNMPIYSRAHFPKIINYLRGLELNQIGPVSNRHM